MVSPLEGALAKTVGKAMRGIFMDAVLTRDVVPDSPAHDPFDPPPAVPVAYPCKAIFDNYGTGQRAGGLVASTDVKVIILATSLAVEPVSGDRITLKGKTVTAAAKGVLGQPAVQTDPAGAVWEIRGLA